MTRLDWETYWTGVGLVGLGLVILGVLLRRWGG